MLRFTLESKAFISSPPEGGRGEGIMRGVVVGEQRNSACNQAHMQTLPTLTLPMHTALTRPLGVQVEGPGLSCRLKLLPYRQELLGSGLCGVGG